MKKNTYDKITKLIIEELEKGNIPWKQPFYGENAPKNLMTKREYKGINRLILSFYTFKNDYERPLFLTYLQCKQLGGYIKKGEKGYPVVYYGVLEREEEDEETGEKITVEIPFCRYSTVFNIDQTEGIPKEKIPALKVNDNLTPNERAESIIKGYKDSPKIIHTAKARAFYNPSLDIIHLPNKEQFFSTDEYYSTLFHELTHSTGHEKRLNRLKDEAFFGNEEYSKEELIAEIGASFLCAKAGIEKTIKNSVAYIQSWLKALKNDKKLIFKASSEAEKAVKYILGESEQAGE